MNILKRIFMFKPTDKSEKFQLSLDDETEFDIRNEENIKTEYVSDSIEKNSSYIKKRFSASVNDDVIIREIVLKNGREAFVIFYDGMTDGKTIDDNIKNSVIELP